MHWVSWILWIVTALVLLYVIVGRERWRAWFPTFFAWFEPIEIRLWFKSETMLLWRFVAAMGSVLTALGGLNVYDFSALSAVLPPKLSWVVPIIPMTLTLLGAMGEWMRRTSTKPIEVVALPDALPDNVVPLVIEAERAKAAATVVGRAVRAGESPEDAQQKANVAAEVAQLQVENKVASAKEAA